MEPKGSDFGGVATHTSSDSQTPDVQTMGAMPVNGQNSAGTTVMPANMTSPPVAADTDTIEEQWVASLEYLFRIHRDDPYTLSAAISQLRKEYLLKRYGKSLDNTR